MNKLTFVITWVALATITAMPPAMAEDEALVVLRSTVKGNQEQPKVLYIVPWQQPGGPENLYQPLESLVNDVFNPVERVEFVRELRYRKMLSDAQIDETNHEQ